MLSSPDSQGKHGLQSVYGIISSVVKKAMLNSQVIQNGSKLLAVFQLLVVLVHMLAVDDLDQAGEIVNIDIHLVYELDIAIDTVANNDHVARFARFILGDENLDAAFLNALHAHELGVAFDNFLVDGEWLGRSRIDSPELKLVRTSGNILLVPEMLVIHNAKMSRFDLVEPVFGALARCYSTEVLGVQDSKANLGDNVVVELEAFDVETNEDYLLLSIEGSRFVDVQGEVCKNLISYELFVF